MNETNHFTLMIETLAEVVEEQSTNRTTSKESILSLRSVLAEFPPLPNESLFLGVAQDGLPVLLNIYDPIPGPIFITGDQGCGKTKLLLTIARAAEMLHLPSQVLYAAITPYPDEWNNLANSHSNVGIHETRNPSTEIFLQGLVNWAHNNKGEEQSILLFIEDLESITKLDGQAEQNLRWLLLRGSSRRVWTFVTLNASRARDLDAWLDFFRTRLFGHIQDKSDAQSVAGDFGEVFNKLLKGTEFTMREGNNWLNFWIPALDEEKE
jgi:hypothetical protein